MKNIAILKDKKAACFAVVVLFVLCASVMIAKAESCPQDLIGYWRLGETAAPYLDQIGSRDGTCTNCPTGATDGAIASDDAQSFDAANDVISIASDPVFSWSETDSFSIELWMKRNSNTVDEVLIGRNDATNQTFWKLEILANGRASLTLQASDGGLSTLTGSKVLDNNVWHHIAAVRNGASDEIMLYVDGVSEDQTTYNYSAGFDSDADLTIGWVDGASNWFGGLLDEVAIYGNALSDNDIRSHYFLSRQYCGVLDTVVRIMPLGDSITDDNQNIIYGTSGNSYRKSLWDDLYANYFLVDFVGSLQSQTTDFDNDHEGHPGMTDDLLATSVQSYLNSNPADVILLHIGTNEFDTSSTAVQSILTNIDAFSSGNVDGKRITVVLARIIRSVDGSLDVNTFNNQVETMAETRIDNGDKIIMVDMQDGAGLVYSTGSGGDFVDNLHPDDGGYVKMSDQWYAKLDTFLPMVESPQITSSPILTAPTGQLYTYDVEATGNPAPTFSLTTNPAGMTINPSTGVIQWTPGATGDEDVVVEARNVNEPWGVDTQAFTISVSLNNAPVITSTAPLAATVGSVYTYSPVATDTDGDTLVWSLAFGPAGMSVSATSGVITWTPAAGDVGTANCSVLVSDGLGGATTQNFTLTVSASSGGSSGGGGCFIQTLF